MCVFLQYHACFPSVGVIMTEIEGEEDLSEDHKGGKVKEEIKEQSDRLEEKANSDDRDTEADISQDTVDRESKVSCQYRL